MTGARIALPLVLALAFVGTGLAVAPRAWEAQFLLAAQDDPVALADHAIAPSFDAAVAAREINAALAANDADLAKSFLDLARDRNVPVDPALAEKVEAANAGAATAARSLGSFARGLVTGEPEDISGSPARRSEICSCSATSAMRCARARDWRAARRPTNWCSAWLASAWR